MSQSPRYSDLFNRILSTQIEHLELSVRPYNTLKRAGINSLGQIIDLGEEGIFILRNLGQIQLDEIFNTVADYLKVERADLADIDTLAMSLNEKDVEIRDIYVTDDDGLSDDHQIISEKPLSPPKDTRPFIVEIVPEATPNPIQYIVPFSKALLQKSKYERGFEIIKRRFGLQGSKEYTLQEIGYYYNLTRERVRQLESRAISKIRDTLLGKKVSTDWRVPQKLIDEANALIELFQSCDELLTEKEIIEIVEDRYSVEFSQKNLNNLRFLLSVFHFRPIPKSLAGFSRDFAPAWIIIAGFRTQPLFQMAKSIYNIVYSSAAPISSFDLRIQLNRRRKKKVDYRYIKLAVKILQEIEIVEEDNFQVKFKNLPSLADQAFRILYENNTPMHLRDLQRQINHRMVKAGFPAEARIRNLGNQMASDSRFQAIGRSGSWSLAEWENIRRETIIELMQEFFHIKQACATADEIYEFVVSKRKNVAKNSIILYLSTNNLFVRVSKTEYELAAWGSKPYQSATKMSSTEIKKLLPSAIKTIFSDRTNKSMPLNELRQKIHKRTAIPESTLYFKIRESPLIRLEDDPASKGQKRKRKIAYYVDDKVPASDTPARSTIRNAVQQEVKLYLQEQPNRKSSVADLAIHIEKATNCKKTTFYRYLSEMGETGDIRKEYEDGKLCCYLETADVYETPTALSFPQIEDVQDNILKGNLVRAINNLTIDNVDLGLFQLGKIFENELKAFLQKAKNQGKFTITSRDLSRLVSMIDCVERHKIIKKKHHLTLLREHRNERAHSKIPNLEERKRLMQHAPFLGDLYIKYILFFNEQRKTL